MNMKKLLLILLHAVKALSLAQCQQATETETLDQDPICLLAHREVNLIVVQIKQFNAILEEGTNINFTNTDDDDD
jgi:hypothetical protein